jgi:hypothetical protein
MGDGRAKTAFELAMEKVAKMPKLNSEELNEERRKESIEKGEAIAQRYIQSTQRKTDIKSEIKAFSPEQEKTGKTAVLNCLSQALSMIQPEQNSHILAGMAAINPDISINVASEQLDKIIKAFHKELNSAFASVELSEIERLKAEGIAGSAVKPNMRASSLWQQKQAEMTAAYSGKLTEFQKTLLPE